MCPPLSVRDHFMLCTCCCSLPCPLIQDYACWSKIAAGVVPVVTRSLRTFLVLLADLLVADANTIVITGAFLPCPIAWKVNNNGSQARSCRSWWWEWQATTIEELPTDGSWSFTFAQDPNGLPCVQDRLGRSSERRRRETQQPCGRCTAMVDPWQKEHAQRIEGVYSRS